MSKNWNKYNILNFCIKLILFTSPLSILLLVYVVTDPFKVVKHYDSYYKKTDIEVNILDADYVSTQTLLNHYKQYNYNAFIFGNSRSIFCRAEYWQNYIGPQNCLHMYAYGEGIIGMERKIELLNRLGAHIDYALIFLDHETLNGISNSQEHLRIEHPALSGQSWISFEWVFLRDFFDANYLPAYLDYLVTGKVKDYMKNVLHHGLISYSMKENEIHFYYADSMIKANANAFYATTHGSFEQRPVKQQYSAAVIGDTQKELLKNIRQELDRQHTKYRVIISPAYDQEKMDTTDLNYLRCLFGSENFSGINPITQDYRNYYDPRHFTYKVAQQLMDSVYTKKISSTPTL